MKNAIKMLGLMALGTVVFASSCKKGDDPADEKTLYVILPGADAQTEAQTALIEMDNGDTIYFNGASFSFNNTLSLEGKDRIVIMGNGRLQTDLNFAGQTAGAEGLKITNADDFTIMHLTITDAKGDAIKVKDSDGVVFRGMGAVWSGTPEAGNGAYGLYPVTCQNVLIDSCYVFGASDAGIYVGQTTNAVVRNSTAEGNVAGIEIENTINADVYNNHSFDNTGGILVFDLPGLTQYGSKTRVFDNLIEENDRANFAPAGNIVANVPPGTGVMVLSTKRVEIFNNTLRNNNIMGLGVVSYAILETLAGEVNTDANYDVYPRYIDIHDNVFSRTSTMPDSLNTIATLLTLNFAADSIPDIMWDGIKASSNTDPSGNICVQNNGTARFANLDAENLFNNVSFDTAVHDCNNGALPAVVIDVP